MRPTYEELEKRVKELEEDEAKWKKEKELLQESKEKYKSFVEGTDAGVAISDIKGKLFYLNDTICKMLGYKKKEAIGKSFSQFIHPEDRKKIMKIFWNATKTITTSRWLEFRVIHKKGHIIWWGCKPTIFRFKGKIKGFSGIIFDITDRKKAEKKLQESYKRLNELNSIINRSPAMAFLWPIKERWPVQYVSDNVEKILGYTPEEFVSGKVSWKGITHPDDIQRLEEEVARFLYNGTMEFSQQYRLITKSGEIRWMNDKNKVLTDMDGNATHIQSIVIDITERINTKDKLRTSEEKYKNFTENIDIGIYRNTPGRKGKFIEINSAMYKMFGYEDKNSFLSVNVSDLYKFPTDRIKFSKKLIKKGFVKNEELELKKKDGTSILCSVTAKAIKSSYGKIKYFDGIIEDITERKLLEKEKQKRSNLEAIQQMIVTLNHKMNQPLQVIYLCSEALFGEAKKDFKLYKNIERIYNSVNEIDKLIKKITNLKEIKSVDYLSDIKMIDLDKDDSYNNR